jgi:NAD(P)-dependent dehydrogenase (short-subunit alcohol dehydrogenase family)
MNSSPSGQRAIFITGGSRGLGLELGREFGRRGFAIAFCGRDADEVARAQYDLERRSIACAGLVADITVQNEIAAAIGQAESRFGGLWGLINDAGIIEVGPYADMTVEDYRRAIDTHVFGPIYAVDAALPGMRNRGEGRIVNIASIGGRVSVPHLLPYSVSKFALVGYSEGLRAALRGDGVLVTTVIPGLMRTGSPENAEFKGRHRSEYAWFSIFDSLPLLTVDVTTAAREIADATERGSPTLTISLPAKILSLVHGVLPGLTGEVLALVNAVLPRAGGIGTEVRRGRESHSAVAPSFLTSLTQRRAVTQNEVPG